MGVGLGYQEGAGKTRAFDRIVNREQRKLGQLFSFSSIWTLENAVLAQDIAKMRAQHSCIRGR